MGDENPIRTLGDYFKPSHQGYKNTIKLPVGNNVVPLRSDTIRLASNWLERLTAGSITTWEDLTTRFLSQFFPLGRTVKLRNDILMFQQHHERFSLRSRTQSWALLEDLALYDNKIWNDPRDFAKPVKAITLPQDVLSTSDRRLIELENQVQRMMKAYLDSTQPTQVNKITTSCEICSDPHDTHYCMEGPEQAYVDYASSRTNKIGGTKKERNQKPIEVVLPKYLSPASIKELNKNPSALKSVHFVNLIVILSTDNDTEAEDVSSTNAHEHGLDSVVKRKKEVKEQGKEDDEMEIDEEIEEVFKDEESEMETEEEVEEVFDDETEDDEDDDTKYYNSTPAILELVYHEWQDEGDRIGVRHLMRLEKEMMDDKGEVT
ncbi:MAK10-like protein [Tanacetum coccineum]